eukprot:COSAG02_NODE_6307_length_3665_cov_3.765564_2_plen_118_part_00
MVVAATLSLVGSASVLTELEITTAIVHPSTIVRLRSLFSQYVSALRQVSMLCCVCRAVAAIYNKSHLIPYAMLVPGRHPFVSGQWSGSQEKIHSTKVANVEHLACDPPLRDASFDRI